MLNTKYIGEMGLKWDKDTSIVVLFGFYIHNNNTYILNILYYLLTSFVHLVGRVFLRCKACFFVVVHALLFVLRGALMNSLQFTNHAT